MNHLELLKKLLIALDDEIHDFSAVGYLAMLGRLTDDEYQELQKLESEAREEGND